VRLLRGVEHHLARRCTEALAAQIIAGFALRATASPIRLADEQPLVSRPLAEGGKPSISLSQAST